MGKKILMDLIPLLSTPTGANDHSAIHWRFIGGPLDGKEADFEPEKLPPVQYAQENIRPAIALGWPMQDPKHVTYHLHRWRADPYNFWFYVLSTLNDAQAAEKVTPIIKEAWVKNILLDCTKPKSTVEG